MTVPARLDHARVLAVAEKAIAERLGYPAPWAILGIKRVVDDPGGYEVMLNSGGNYIAVASALRAASYEVTDPPPGTTSTSPRLRVALPQWALDELSARLRLARWEPPVVLACGCQPQYVCPHHAAVRAADHYGATG